MPEAAGVFRSRLITCVKTAHYALRNRVVAIPAMNIHPQAHRVMVDRNLFENPAFWGLMIRGPVKVLSILPESISEHPGKLITLTDNIAAALAFSFEIFVIIRNSVNLP
jgi:hypothetical protein